MMVDFAGGNLKGQKMNRVSLHVNFYLIKIIIIIGSIKLIMT